MSRRFVLSGLVVCGAVFFMNLAFWLHAIIQGLPSPGSAPVLTLVSGFATAMYFLYYRAKFYRSNNKLKR